MNSPPHASVWTDIPDDCRMTVALTFDHGALKLELPEDFTADLPELVDAFHGVR